MISGDEVGELDAVIGQDRVGAVRHGFQQVFEELPCRSPASLVDQLGDRELGGAVNADEQVELALTFGRIADGTACVVVALL